jgi:hypothetical protein
VPCLSHPSKLGHSNNSLTFANSHSLQFTDVFNVRCLITTFNHQNFSASEPTYILVDDSTGLIRRCYVTATNTGESCASHGSATGLLYQNKFRLPADSCDHGLVCLGIEFAETFVATDVSYGSSLHITQHVAYIITIKVLAMLSDNGQ